MIVLLYSEISAPAKLQTTAYQWSSLVPSSCLQCSCWWLIIVLLLLSSCRHARASKTSPASPETGVMNRLVSAASSPGKTLVATVAGKISGRETEWQALLSEYEDEMDLEIVNKVFTSINETVNRLRCPRGVWKRIGRSCYNVLGASTDPLPALVSRCQQLAADGKTAEDARSRASVAVVTDLLELQMIVGYMRQVNMSRFQMMLSAELTETVVMLDQRMDLLAFTGGSGLFNARPYCSSLLLHNAADIPTSRAITELDELASDSPPSSNVDSARRSEQRPNVHNSHCFLLDDMLVSQVYGDTERSSYKCLLYYNTNCVLDEPIPVVCKYSNNLCSANPICGSHGRCVDTIRDGLRCECGFLYGGFLCNKITREGVQIIVCVGLIVMVMFANNWFVRSCFIGCFKVPIWLFLRRKDPTSPFPLSLSRNPSKRSTAGLSRAWAMLNRKLKYARDCIFFRSATRSRLGTCFSSIRNKSTTTNTRDRTGKRSVSAKMPSSKHGHDPGVVSTWKNSGRFKRNCLVGALTLVMVTTLLVLTSLTQLLVFKTDEYVDEYDLEHHINRSLSVVKKCQVMSSFVHENLISFPFAALAIMIFAWFVKRDQYLRRCCGGRPGLPMPLEPFNTRHRFTTAVIFGLLSCEILKIFEELLFKVDAGQPLGILFDLSVRTGFVFLIGMRYYPLLASLQFVNNPVCSGVGCVYALFDAVYVILKQGLCMGFVPMATTAGLVDEARLRLELGSWYVVYGLIRNAPHFSCIAYVCAELCMRFYESLHGKQLSESHIVTSVKNQTNMGAKTPPLTKATLARMPATYASCWQEVEESIAAYSTINTAQDKPLKLPRTSKACRLDNAPNIVYVRNLLQRSVWIMRRRHKHGADQSKTNLMKRMCWRIYQWRDDFRYSTIAVCTFVTSFIFLYYLACTLVFYHLSRTEGHGFVLNFYFQHILNIRPSISGLGDKASGQATGHSKLLNNGITFWREIFLAGFVSFCIFAFQVFHSMKQYRSNKLMMYKGIFEDVPSARYLKPSKMIAQSVHYSGFLIGYMAWGFIIVFYMILLCLCTISVVTRQRVKHIETAFAFVAPVAIIYALKVLLVRSTSKVAFTQGFGSRMALNNRRTHAVFVYFSFFFDCFLGIVACFARLSKSILLNILFMARLDYSFVGRPLERLDPGFSTYVAFLHTEVAHTHPVMVAFCEIAWRQIVLQRMGVIARSDEKSSRREAVRFRWFLAYTLLRNGGMLNFRKNLSFRLQLIVNYRYASRAHATHHPGNGRRAVSSYAARQTTAHYGPYPSNDGVEKVDLPSIRIYSTTGVGHLSAGAGEKVDDKSMAVSSVGCSEDPCLGNDNNGNFDETTALLMSHDVNTVPLVFEATYSTRIPNAEFLSYNMSFEGSICNADDLAHGYRGLNASEVEPTTFLRIASYSERDALWRQGVRERVYARSKYRYHYGCLNHMPAVKALDLEHYRRLSVVHGVPSRPSSCPQRPTRRDRDDGSGVRDVGMLGSQPCLHGISRIVKGITFDCVSQAPSLASSSTRHTGSVSSRPSNDQSYVTARSYVTSGSRTSSPATTVVASTYGTTACPPSVPPRPRRVPVSPWMSGSCSDGKQ